MNFLLLEGILKEILARSIYAFELVLCSLTGQNTLLAVLFVFEVEVEFGSSWYSKSVNKYPDLSDLTYRVKVTKLDHPWVKRSTGFNLKLILVSTANGDNVSLIRYLNIIDLTRTSFDTVLPISIGSPWRSVTAPILIISYNTWRVTNGFLKKITFLSWVGPSVRIQYVYWVLTV